MLALEVVPLPVTDIDRALAFYTEQAGFTLDVDYRPTADFRVVQLTPPGSACSVQLVMADSPGRVHNLYLVTTDLGRSSEIDRSWRRSRRDPAQGPSRNVGRRMERGAGPQASRLCQFRRPRRQYLDRPRARIHPRLNIHVVGYRLGLFLRP